MVESLVVLLLLSGLFCSSSAVSRQYNYMNLPMSWPDAQSYCRERFTDLATVDTVEDVNRLINTVDAGYNGSVWIGLKRATQKRWVWSDGDDTIAQYKDWGPGEPVSGNDCVYLNRTWLTANCSDLKSSICINAGGYYAIILLDKNWSEAQTYCRQNFADMVTIRNSVEETTVINIVIKYTPFWIGLFRDSWEWSDKWNRSFRYWAAGQPTQSAGSVDCVGMTRNDSGQWAPYSCDLQQPFICYGDDKLIRKQTVRLKLSCNGNCKLHDSSLQTAILNQVTKRLKSMELESNSKISWIKGNNGEVFHQEINHMENRSEEECKNTP
ncbi:macrophage mannose receptor 1-like [Danio rerio]|uniref:Macrophage mannose receptor 1-like n=1 Tax=Danio rerio TaxID=7955 RepID=A0AC58HY73_DANRE